MLYIYIYIYIFLKGLSVMLCQKEKLIASAATNPSNRKRRKEGFLIRLLQCPAVIVGTVKGSIVSISRFNWWNWGPSMAGDGYELLLGFVVVSVFCLMAWPVPYFFLVTGAGSSRLWCGVVLLPSDLVRLSPGEAFGLWWWLLSSSYLSRFWFV